MAEHDGVARKGGQPYALPCPALRECSVWPWGTMSPAGRWLERVERNETRQSGQQGVKRLWVLSGSGSCSTVTLFLPLIPELKGGEMWCRANATMPSLHCFCPWLRPEPGVKLQCTGAQRRRGTPPPLVFLYTASQRCPCP